MSTTTPVLPLDRQRGRRERRLRRALALLSHDEGRGRLALQLADLLVRVGGDRAVLAWVDDLEPTRARPHVVVDLASDRPRREVPMAPLMEAWDRGVPGFVDRPDGVERAGDVRGSVAVAALGSDGLRAWFVLLEGTRPRSPLSDERLDELAFRTGEVTGVVLHPSAGPGFRLWRTLTPPAGEEEARDAGARSVRFLLLRMLQALADDAFRPEPDEFEERRAHLATEIEPFRDRPEGVLWGRLLDAASALDLPALQVECSALGAGLVDAGELESAVEAFRVAYELCVARGDADEAVECARLLGRTFRNLGRWDASEAWYGTAATLAQVVGDPAAEAIAMDGWANTLRVRGAYPAARHRLARALEVARRSGSGSALGAVHHSLMTLAALTGDTVPALEHGWAAVEAYDTRRERLRALVTLGGLLVEADEGELAERAYEAALAHLEEPYFRLFALDGFAHAAALRGDQAAYRVRSRTLDAADWRPGGPDFAGQVYLYRGRAWERLGRPEDAREWFERAVTWSEGHGLSATLFAAQAGLERVAAAVSPPDPAPLDPEIARLMSGRLERVGRALAASAG